MSTATQPELQHPVDDTGCVKDVRQSLPGVQGKPRGGGRHVSSPPAQLETRSIWYVKAQTCLFVYGTSSTKQKRARRHMLEWLNLLDVLHCSSSQGPVRNGFHLSPKASQTNSAGKGKGWREKQQLAPLPYPFTPAAQQKASSVKSQPLSAVEPFLLPPSGGALGEAFG